MEKKTTQLNSKNFERFNKYLNQKIENDENYTTEDRNKFYLSIYKLVCNNKKKEINIFKKLVYIFDDGEKFGNFVKDSYLADEIDFARNLVKLNPNLIYYFNEDVRKDAKILDYLTYNAPVGTDLKWPLIKFDKNIVKNGFVKLDKKRSQDFEKRWQEANPVHTPRSSRRNYADFI